MPVPDNYAQYELFYDKENYYFKPFPYVNYDINGNGNTMKIKNFLKRFDFLKLVRENGSIYIKWVVRDEDTSEIIAHKMYGSSHFYWVILMLNRMVDPTFSWPMTSDDLHDYVMKKYGEENIYNHHHWESVDTGDEYDLPNGIIVDETYPHKISISNNDYELIKNDEKREILILKKEYIHLVKEEWKVLGQTNFTKVRQ